MRRGELRGTSEGRKGSSRGLQRSLIQPKFLPVGTGGNGPTIYSTRTAETRHAYDCLAEFDYSSMIPRIRRSIDTLPLPSR
jgi:hypothetical protein